MGGGRGGQKSFELEMLLLREIAENLFLRNQATSRGGPVRGLHLCSQRVMPGAVAECPGPATPTPGQPGRGADICVGAEADVAFLVGKQYAFVRVCSFFSKYRTFGERTRGRNTDFPSRRG